MDWVEVEVALLGVQVVVGSVVEVAEAVAKRDQAWPPRAQLRDGELQDFCLECDR